MSWTALALLLALSAQLRIGAALGTVVDTPVRADAADYFWYAFNLKEFGTFSRRPPGEPLTAPEPDSLRSPGYPVLLTLITDHPPTARSLLRIAVVQALLGVAVTGLAFALARSVLPPVWALGAAGLTALSPHLVSAGTYLLTETLFSFAVLLPLLALARSGEGRRPAWLLAAGLLLGLATLVRPTLLYFPVALCGFFVWREGPARALRASALMLLGFGLAVGPWSLRNAALPGGTDPQLKINMLHHGMYPDFTYEGVPESYGFPYRADPRGSEIGSSLEAVQVELARRFREEPARHLRWFLLGKPVALWGWNDAQAARGPFVYPVLQTPYDSSPLFRASSALMQALHWPLAIFGAAFSLAIWLPMVQRRVPPAAVFPAQACALMVLYVTALHTAGFPLARYMTPFRPELYILACAGLALVFGYSRRT